MSKKRILSTKSSQIPTLPPELETITDDELEKNLARHSLSFFLEYESQGVWQSARHLELLCSKLEAVERGEIKRLMVFMPPRHGKSEVVSKKFPAWFLARNPNKEVIVSSYSADLAYDFSRIARNTLKQWGPELFGADVAKDSGAVGRWGIEGTRGGMMAAGVGGPITGRGAHVAIIDDPFKNWEDAESKVIRDKVWDWYRSTLRTRLAPNGAVVLVMTRWHEDDLGGRLLQAAKADGEEWDVVSLPAVAEEGDALGRSPGEVLWPERFTEAEYDATRRAIGSRLWAALYQQRPAPDEGTILKREWWKFYKERPAKFDQVLQSWDCTFKDAASSDYVVGQVWGKLGADRYLLYQVRARMTIVETMQAIRNLTTIFPEAHAKLIEDKANGPAVIQMLNREISGLIPVNPEGGKVVRAQAVAPQIESGNVFLPDLSIAPWVADFIEECAAFPNGVNDDQVDSMTQALTRFGSGYSAWLSWLTSEAEALEEEKRDDAKERGQ